MANTEIPMGRGSFQKVVYGAGVCLLGLKRRHTLTQDQKQLTHAQKESTWGVCVTSLILWGCYDWPSLFFVGFII